MQSIEWKYTRDWNQLIIIEWKIWNQIINFIIYLWTEPELLEVKLLFVASFYYHEKHYYVLFCIVAYGSF